MTGLSRVVLRAALAVLCVGNTLGAPRRATTIYVDGAAGSDAWSGLCATWDGDACGPKATIQAGIDAAENGDTVIIADGTYTGTGNRDLTFGGRLITVRSANGPENCIINCQGSVLDPHRGFDFGNGETRAAVLDGVTVANGYVYYDNGGAISCLDSSPSIVNCVFANDTVSIGSGAGCYSSGGSPLISACRFDDCDNESDGWYDVYGGGIYCIGGAPEVVDNFFIGCHFDVFCTSGGGAIACKDATIVIRGNTMVKCGGHGAGGAIWAYNCQVDIRQNTIMNCGGYHYGGGIALWNSNGQIFQNLIADNMVDHMRGGGLYICGGSVDIVACTIANNFLDSPDGEGGGVCAYSAAVVKIRNSILWGNRVTYRDEQIFLADSAVATASYCDIEDGWAGNGNIAYDPDFFDADGPDNDPYTWADNDYRLYAYSPCIDAGSNVLPLRDVYDLDADGCVTDPWPVDLEGHARYHDDPVRPDTGQGAAPIVDLGCYERLADATLPPGPCPGDMNCDGVVGYGDIDPLVLALAGSAAYQAVYPDCEWLSADCNNDGTVNYTDIDVFIALLTGP